MLKDQGNYNANCPPGEICAPLQQVSGALQTNEMGRGRTLSGSVGESHCATRAAPERPHQLMCCADLNTRCAWQESHLAVLWTIGVFALNFGPVVVGPILDYVGPKLTAMLGEHSHVPDRANTPLKQAASPLPLLRALAHAELAPVHFQKMTRHRCQHCAGATARSTECDAGL